MVSSAGKTMAQKLLFIHDSSASKAEKSAMMDGLTSQVKGNQ